MNEQNLRPFTSDQNREEARKNGKKGGIASGKARRERRKFREELLLALETIKDGKTIQERGVEAILEKFMNGDIQAFTTVRDTIGEKPIEKIEADVGLTEIKVELEE
jgi:hypothetical protein